MPVKVKYTQFGSAKEVTYEEGTRVLKGHDDELEVCGGNRVVALHAPGAWDSAEVISLDKKPHEETPALYLAISNLAASLENLGDEQPYVDRAGLVRDLRRLLSGSAVEDKVQDA